MGYPYVLANRSSYNMDVILPFQLIDTAFQSKAAVPRRAPVEIDAYNKGTRLEWAGQGAVPSADMDGGGSAERDRGGGYESQDCAAERDERSH
ncbi:hypothetical protein CDD80_1279 [Ophiocordyceps camponoti-rufipedis]|uniref:Uncharacterized protein n=1 Tax=Ophiocordyceps camponoti-rufipedis TaxID=2004952 RepID=A0A2C5ZL57_9HYPO|nr:hypothetical protein CDD80_1279 [Ophiocordyceps camponoti-rufipedis]